MKFLLVITSEPHSMAHFHAKEIVKALEAQSHEILALFFTKQAVQICSEDQSPYHELPSENKLLVCSKALYDRKIENINQRFVRSGNTELITLIEQADKILEF